MIPVGLAFSYLKGQHLLGDAGRINEAQAVFKKSVQASRHLFVARLYEKRAKEAGWI